MNIAPCEATLATRFHVAEAGTGQVFIVARPRERTSSHEAAASAYAQIANTLSGRGLEIVHERVFGSLSVEPAVRAAREEAPQERSLPADGPLTYVEGGPPWGEGFAGVIVHAVSCSGPNAVWPIVDKGVPCGRGWRRNGVTFIVLQNIDGIQDGGECTASRPRQAQRMLDRADRILRQHGVSFRNVARTWFYLSDILDWYGDFNEVRSGKYEESGIMPNSHDTRLLLPASTGVRGDNPRRTACVLDLIAVTGPAQSRPLVKQMNNWRQKDAFRYGSAFSRGALIREADVSLVEVSGTAAIDEDGTSLYPDDIRGQIECTFNNVEALISQEGARLEDICAATVFVKRPEDAELYWEMASARGLGEFPGVCVVADVCRDELLVEIDAEVAVDADSM